MAKKAERMLHLAADMQRFTKQDDQLEKMTAAIEEELSEDELDFVAAAASTPSFAEFLKRHQK